MAQVSAAKRRLGEERQKHLFLQRGPEAFALQVAELDRLLGALKLELPGEEIFSH